MKFNKPKENLQMIQAEMAGKNAKIETEVIDIFHDYVHTMDILAGNHLLFFHKKKKQYQPKGGGRGEL